MKRTNGTIEYFDDGHLTLTCGAVSLEATARIDAGDAGPFLSGTVRRGPAQTVGKQVLVGTTNFIDAHIHITN